MAPFYRPGSGKFRRRWRRKWALLAVLASTATVCWFASHGLDNWVGQQGRQTEPHRKSNQVETESADTQRYRALRAQMVEAQLRARDITDPQVLLALGKVPRHQFVRESERHLAYSDGALPIGHEQTISQPYVVALMTQCAQPNSDCKALDVGTGSGYQAAVLGELCDQVFSIEIVKPLAESARTRLADYPNIKVRYGDGYQGWPDQAPFDVIIVAAAPDHIPQPLIDQLAPGGRLVLPVGDRRQQLMVLHKDEQGTVRRRVILPVAFVPMTGPSIDGAR